MSLRNAFENLSTEAKQDAANALLAAIRDQLKDATPDTVLSLLRAIATNNTVGLDSASLAALETITVGNFPVNQQVSGTVAVSNPTANPETGLAKDTTLTSGAQRTEVTNLPANQPVSVTAPLPVGTNNIGFVSPSSSQKVGQGRFMLAGTGRLSLSVAGNVRVHFLNPVGSGKNISIVRIAGISTSTGWASIIVNPTVGLPVGLNRPVTNAIVGGGVPAVGQVTVDTSATTPLSGGTDTGIVIGLGANMRTTIDLPPLVIAPGVSVGLNIPFTGSAEASMSVYWIED